VIPTMRIDFVSPTKKPARRLSLLAPSLLALTTLGISPHLARAQAPATAKPAAPEWAQPGSANHTQVAPPADFHRPSTNFATPIGIFEGQSDIGSALVPRQL
jgi:hypothetical protein